MRGGRHFLGSSVPLLLALALAACGGAPPAQGPQVPQVTVATPLVKPILDWDEYVGRFEAVQAVEVRPRVSGYVSRLAFRDGQFAKAGELLFEIDPRPYRAALAQAQAQAARAKAAAALAKANLARTEKLFADAVVAQEEVDTARANAAGAQADLAAAEAAAEQRALDLGFTRVTAPIGGRLSDRRVSVGGYVTAGQTVLTSVVSMNPIYFSFTGSESIYLKYTRANQAGTRPSSRVAPNPVEIRLADETLYRWRGQMDFVDNALDPGSGTIRGRAVVANPDGFLTPGMFGHMRLIGSGAYEGMLIPDESVITDQTRKVVMVLAPGNTVQPRVVVLGPLVDGLRVVRSGLQRTDRIVIAGGQMSQPGSKVQPRDGKIVPPAPGTGPATPAVITPPATSATAAQ